MALENCNELKCWELVLIRSEKNYRDYLCVDQYLQDFMQVQILNGAFELGLIDKLLAGSCSFSQLLETLETDTEGLQFMLGLLVRYRVVTTQDAHIDTGAQAENSEFALNDDFVKALRFRDLMEAKIFFANLLAPDLVEHMASFVSNEQEFMSRSKLFELFDYQKALESTPENVRFTERWMKLTTALTRYEAAACLANYDFSNVQKMMDIGGNSGEFALQITRKNSHVQATVVDLPVVCDVGQMHVAPYPESDRIQFVKANALADALPDQQCLVSFKSILHDWPVDAAERFLEQAYSSLKPGGSVVIFERAPIPIWGESGHSGHSVYGSLPTLLFFRSYRPADIYQNLLVATGFEDIEVESIELETPFHMIIANKR